MQDDLIIHTLRWEILRHQYGICVAESQTFLLAKRPQRRRAKEKRMLSQANINCDMIVSKKVNDDDKYILHHAEIPGDGGLVVPQQRSYMYLGSVSYPNVSAWLTDVAGRLPTLQNEKTRLVLHFRKKPLQTM